MVQQKKLDLEKFIFETPITYDMETDELEGTIEPSTKTKWAVPPDPNISVQELRKWVKQKVNEKVFSKLLGNGATRIALNNDNKTVFKFNYVTSLALGNQILEEVKIYNKFKKMFSNILPKFYRYGTNWIVQEKSEPFSNQKFSEIVDLNGMTNIASDASNYVTIFFKNLDYILLNLDINYLERLRKMTFDEAKKTIENDGLSKYFKSYKPWNHYFLQNDILMEIIRFCKYSGTILEDMKSENLGFIGNRLVIIDFGMVEQ